MELRIANEFNERFVRCKELKFVIKTLLEVAANEMFFADFLWGSTSAVLSLLDTGELIQELEIWNRKLMTSWQEMLSQITHDIENVGNIMKVVFIFLDPEVNFSAEISAIRKEYEQFLFDTGQYL